MITNHTDMNNTDLKWVACWGNATSITDRREAVYAKNLTLRYPVRMPFAGSALRFRFSNLTGTEHPHYLWWRHQRYAAAW